MAKNTQQSKMPSIPATETLPYMPGNDLVDMLDCVVETETGAPGVTSTFDTKEAGRDADERAATAYAANPVQAPRVT